MTTIRRAIQQMKTAPLVDDERGASVLEYIVLAVLIIGVCFVAVETLGTNTNTKFEAAGTAVEGMTGFQ